MRACSKKFKQSTKATNTDWVKLKWVPNNNYLHKSAKYFYSKFKTCGCSFSALFCLNYFPKLNHLKSSGLHFRKMQQCQCTHMINVHIFWINNIHHENLQLWRYQQSLWFCHMSFNTAEQEHEFTYICRFNMSISSNSIRSGVKWDYLGLIFHNFPHNKML